MLVLTGCGEYKTFTLKKGVGYFSFEYPSHFKVEDVEINDDYHYTDVTILGPWLEKEKGNSLIGVFVMEPDEYNPNAKTVLEGSLRLASELPDFELLDRYPVTVAGIQGEQYIFFCLLYPESLYTYEVEPAPTIFKRVFFDYGGFIWKITFRSNTSTAETDQVYFDHLLETFTIFN